jgi:hypothetical protein
MSVSAQILNRSRYMIDNFAAFYRMSVRFFQRNNPALAFYQNILNSIKGILSLNTKRKIAKYRLNHYLYRLNQMEQLINQSNPHNYGSGRRINHIR